MTIQDKTLTVIGAQTTLQQVTLSPQADGSIVLIASGVTKDNGGNAIGLTPARLQVTGVPVLDNLVARALSELRKANGLEV